MTSAASPHRDKEPKSPPEPKPKTLAQQKSDFTAEGAPPLDPALPGAVKPRAPKKALPQTPAPPASTRVAPPSGSHR